MNHSELCKYFSEKYLCAGCVNGTSPDSCKQYKEHPENKIFRDKGPGCIGHVCGTSILGLTGLMLGFPKGFNLVPEGYKFSQDGNHHTISYCFLITPRTFDYLNIPVWKHLDEHGNTIVKILSPRTCRILVDVILGNHMDQINCHELTREMMENID